jgi:hypothetical protein
MDTQIIGFTAVQRTGREIGAEKRGNLMRLVEEEEQ